MSEQEKLRKELSPTSEDIYAPPRSDVNPGQGDAGIPDGPVGSFVDPRPMGRVLVYLLLLEIIGQTISTGLYGVELAILGSGQGDAYLEGTNLEWFGSVLIVVPLFWVVLLLLTFVFFGRWILRCSRNAWALAQLHRKPIMTVRPGWAVGYYFIPIANLWMPYRAMKEIRDVSDQGNLRVIMPWWWAFWLISSFVGNISMRMDTDTMEGYTASARFDLATLPIDWILSGLAIVLVRRITRAQAEHAGIED